MIATALTFVFGFLTATLIALVISPLFSSRSRRLALRDYRASIPASAREVRASLDHVRAEAALGARRREMKADEATERAALERAEAGRVAGENAELRARNTALAENLSEVTAELEDVNAQLTLRNGELEELDAELRAVGNDLDLRSDELSALADRFGELSAIADERRATIVALETRIEDLSDGIRQAEREFRERGHAIDRLSGETSALQAHLAKEKQVVRRLDEKTARLTGQLADRDAQIARLLGEAASTAARGNVQYARVPRDRDQGLSEDDEDPKDDARLRLRPAVRPTFGRKIGEAEAGAGSDAGSGPVVGSADRADSPGTSHAKTTVSEGPVLPVVAAVPARPAKPSELGAASGSISEANPERSLARALGLSERPDFPDDLGDEALRQKVGELAARVIALTAEKEGSRAALDAILAAEMASPVSRSAHADLEPSLADRVRKLREEVRDQAAE